MGYRHRGREKGHENSVGGGGLDPLLAWQLLLLLALQCSAELLLPCALPLSLPLSTCYTLITQSFSLLICRLQSFIRMSSLLSLFCISSFCTLHFRVAAEGIVKKENTKKALLRKRRYLPNVQRWSIFEVRRHSAANSSACP